MDGVCASLQMILMLLVISTVTTSGLFETGGRYLCQFQQVLRLVCQFSQVYACLHLFHCTDLIRLLLSKLLLTLPAFPAIAPFRDQKYIVCLLRRDICRAHRA